MVKERVEVLRNIDVGAIKVVLDKSDQPGKVKLTFTGNVSPTETYSIATDFTAHDFLSLYLTASRMLEIQPKATTTADTTRDRPSAERGEGE